MKEYVWKIPCAKDAAERTPAEAEAVRAALQKFLSFLPDEAQLCIRGLDECSALNIITEVRREKAQVDQCKNFELGTLEGDEWDDIPLDNIYFVPAGDGFTCYTSEDLDNIAQHMDGKDPFTNQAIDVPVVKQLNTLQYKMQVLLDEVEDEFDLAPIPIETQIEHALYSVFDGFGANTPDPGTTFLNPDALYGSLPLMYSLITNIHRQLPLMNLRMGPLGHQQYGLGFGGHVVRLPVRYEEVAHDLRQLQLRFLQDLDLTKGTNGEDIITDLINLSIVSVTRGQAPQMNGVLTEATASNHRKTIQGQLAWMFTNL